MNAPRPLATPTAEALSKSAVSRYLQLAGMFRRRIEQGEWALDQRIPTITELAADCGVAAVTVRRALDILEEDGLIERFRAKGTFVRRRPERDTWCAVNTDFSGLLIARYSSRIEVLEDVPSPPPAFLSAGDWPGVSAPRYRRIRRRHWRQGAAFLVADLYVEAGAYAALPEGALASMTAMQMASAVPGRAIAAAEQELTVTGADLSVANELSVRLGEPMARVVRVAVDEAGQRFLAVEGIYRGDSARLRVTLK
ncbi:GntR family transcriptional regulator [Mameliella alba]|uniref:GntR family transcriptional regulator n=1 Tax=Mameliella alba TaxID=561184 RepID=UPI000B537560|nr:GntR family transcriptional regulator [Mameliella alba]OWV41297.1 GntR family transcriptional regulator [Mameliella alba]OWV57647.1 GntR family transcriptional regulator [Mameliella alba]